MKAALLQHRRWLILAGLLTLALLIPVWSVRFPPLQDYPNHLARAYISLHLQNPGSPFSRCYILGLSPVPNALSDLALLALGRALPIETAGKVLLSINLMALPWAVFAFLRAAGHPNGRALSLFGWVVAYSHFAHRGYLNYCLGLWLLFLTLACALRFLRAGKRAWLWGALAALCAALTYLSHLLTFAALAETLALLALAGPGRLQRALRVGALFLPGLALMILYTLSACQSAGGGATFVWTGYPSAMELARTLGQSFMAFDTRRDLLSYAPALAVWTGLLAWSLARLVHRGRVRAPSLPRSKQTPAFLSGAVRSSSLPVENRSLAALGPAGTLFRQGTDPVHEGRRPATQRSTPHSAASRRRQGGELSQRPAGAPSRIGVKTVGRAFQSAHSGPAGWKTLWLAASGLLFLCALATPLALSAITAEGQRVDILLRAGQRFVLPALLLALAGFPHLSPRLERAAAAALSLSAVAVIAGAALSYHRYQPGLAQTAAALQQLAPSEPVGHYVDVPYTCNTNPYRHFVDYVAIWRNAPVAELFADYSLLRERIPMPRTLSDGLTAETLPAVSRFYPQLAILSENPPAATGRWYERIGGAGVCSLWRLRPLEGRKG